LINYKKAFLVTEEFYPKHKNSKSLYNLRVANVFIKKGQFIEALKKVNNCDLLDKSQDFNFLKSLIYKKLKKVDSSLYYSYKFLKFKNKSPDTQKSKIVVYNILAELYNERNKIDSAFKYSKLAMGMLKRFNENKSNAHKTHHIYDFNQIKKVNNYIIKNEFNKRKQLIILFLLIIFSGLIFGYFFLKRKKEKYDYLGPPVKKEYSINIEIEEIVLKNLEVFELSNDFLSSDFNISVLAKKLNTNTSYLSSIINEKKEKTFKVYITELRINYLIQNLEKDPMLKKYTVKALGEEIGYTNASSFSRSFKNYTGMPPSKYLDSLE
jgi:AraC-like DNA-binding protein